MTTPHIQVLEGFPERILARIECRDRRLRQATSRAPGGSPFELVMARLKTWKVGTLRVGFRGGDSKLHGKVASSARIWTEYGGIEFDFGDDTSSGSGEYRQWSEQDKCHIRVGFGQEGYWSLVGTDSVDQEITDYGETSLNLSGFDDTLPTDWAGTVLHEFGHALGFHHEHQSPVSNCDFDWDRLYQNLAGPPNYWPKWKVDHNLRQLGSAGLVFSEHDPDSIMHYSFSKWMFKKGDASPCFTPPNNDLSHLDKRMMENAYPRDIEEQASTNAAKIGHLESLLESGGDLPGNTRATLERHREFLAGDTE